MSSFFQIKIHLWSSLMLKWSRCSKLCQWSDQLVFPGDSVPGSLKKETTNYTLSKWHRLPVLVVQLGVQGRSLLLPLPSLTCCPDTNSTELNCTNAVVSTLTSLVRCIAFCLPVCRKHAVSVQCERQFYKNVDKLHLIVSITSAYIHWSLYSAGSSWLFTALTSIWLEQWWRKSSFYLTKSSNIIKNCIKNRN